jgi:hypothetical protein
VEPGVLSGSGGEAKIIVGRRKEVWVDPTNASKIKLPKGVALEVYKEPPPVDISTTPGKRERRPSAAYADFVSPADRRTSTKTPDSGGADSDKREGDGNDGAPTTPSVLKIKKPKLKLPKMTPEEKERRKALLRAELAVTEARIAELKYMLEPPPAPTFSQPKKKKVKIVPAVERERRQTYRPALDSIYAYTGSDAPDLVIEKLLMDADDSPPPAGRSALKSSGSAGVFAPKPRPKPSTPEEAERMRMCRQAGSMIKDVMRQKDSLPFNNPVDPVALGIPDYPKIVKRPMDFGTIKNKLEDLGYQTLEDVRADAQLVFSNCMSFNPPESAICDMALRLKKLDTSGWA